VDAHSEQITMALRALERAIVPPRPGDSLGTWRWSVRQRLGHLREALAAVDLFLDGAALQSLKSVNIIHGKGTGILRAGIRDHLKRHPVVKEFRLGRYGEGEDGVTVVTLK